MDRHADSRPVVMRWTLLALAALYYRGHSSPPRPNRRSSRPRPDELASIMRHASDDLSAQPARRAELQLGQTERSDERHHLGESGILLKPHKQKKFKNDGIWRRIRVDAVNPEKELKLQVLNVQKPEKGKLTFDMVVTLPTRIKFEQQLWKSGSSAVQRRDAGPVPADPGTQVRVDEPGAEVRQLHPGRRLPHARPRRQAHLR